MEQQVYKNWKMRRDGKGILWLAINRDSSRVNSLNQEVLQELDQLLDEIKTDSSINSVVIYSSKKTGFIAGADITQFVELKSVEEAFNLIRQGQLVFNKLADLPKPTTAMIDGFCLGGGLELALACRYRVAEEESKLGCPEVHLGIIPGWGGTVRLPLLIGAPQAMRLIATGKMISAKEALKLGMVDEALPRRVLEKAAFSYALDTPPIHRPTFLQSLTNSVVARPLLAKMFVAKLKEKVNSSHYPAPFEVIQNWETLGPENPNAMLREARSISELLVHPTAHNLIRVFFLKERLKGLAKGLRFKSKHVHVVGAGTMGSGIAAWCAINGLMVTLQDQSPERIAAGLNKANQIIKSKLRSERKVLVAMDYINPDVQGLGVSKADIIIEAIVEDLVAKQTLYKQLEKEMKPSTLLATNTSSLTLSELRKTLDNPSQLVGIHFFNPVEKMELVEVIHDEETDYNRVEDAIAFVRQINRLPLPVKSRPGFLVNRILMPYLLEGMILLEEGMPAFVIDHAAKDFGMPIGPLELADRVGLDVCLSVAEIFAHHFGGKVPAKLQDKVTEGKFGTKSGEGFYRYQAGKLIQSHRNIPETLAISKQDLTDRLILCMIKEAEICLQEEIVADADLLDAGMIFGTGFAPFRGGPMNYARTRGLSQINERLVQLANQYGERFKPGHYQQTPSSEAPNPDAFTQSEKKASVLSETNIH